MLLTVLGLVIVSTGLFQLFTRLVPVVQRVTIDAQRGAWGDPAVTELQVLKDNSIALSAYGIVPTGTGQGLTTLQHVGLLRKITMKVNIPFSTVASGAVAPTLDVNGPWNLINLMRFDVNGIAPLYAISGIGAYLVSIVSGSPFAAVDSQNGALATDAAAFADVFAFPAVTTSTASYQLTACFDLPFSVDISLPSQTLNIPTELGLWLLQNQTTDVNVTILFNNLNNSTALTAPYQAGSGLTYTYGAATIDFEREFYRVPQSVQNMPDLSFAVQWQEKLIPFTGSAQDFYIDRAGILLRVVLYIIDAATNDGVVTSKVQAIQFVYGANETPINFDPVFIRKRQLVQYGKLLPKGCYAFEPFRWTGTPYNLVGSLKLVYNTESIINQRMHVDFTSSLAAGSYCRMLTQRLIPIVANRTASPVTTSGQPVGTQAAPMAA